MRAGFLRKMAAAVRAKLINSEKIGQIFRDEVKMRRKNERISSK